MRSKDPELMKKIGGFIDQFYNEKLRFPSVNEVAKGVGIAKTTSYRYLVEMDELGMLQYDGKERHIITKKIENKSAEASDCAVVGSVSCGPQLLEEENIERYVSLPASIFGRGDMYILRASGDSMTDAGIYEGDLLVILKQHEARPGDIIVALDEFQENTLKRYEGLDQDGMHVLGYMNEASYHGKKILLRSLTVQGVCKFVIKPLLNSFTASAV